jgi:hypothetical protein
LRHVGCLFGGAGYFWSVLVMFPFLAKTLQAVQFFVGTEPGALQAGLVLPEAVEGLEVIEAEGVLEEDGVLGAVDTKDLPLGSGHFLDQEMFRGGLRPEFVLDLTEQVVEILLIFGGEDEGGSAKAVAEGVEADVRLTFAGLRAGGELGVAAVGRDLFLGRHMFFFASKANFWSGGGFVPAPG